MPVIPTTPWAELEPYMQTGDLILFSGPSNESRWIELFTGGMYSHSTMIYRPDPNQPPWMWQEAPDPIVDDPWMRSHDPSKVRHGGAQIGDALAATQVIRYSYGDIPYYLQLSGDLSAKLNVAMAALVATYEDRPFGTIAEMAMHYVMGHEFDIDSGEDTLFCAQLVALTFMKLGLFKDTHPANWYSPNSFAMPQASDLPWAMSTSFTLPVQIDVPPIAAMAALSETQLARWPAGPIAPAQLATAPTAPWTS